MKSIHVVLLALLALLLPTWLWLKSANTGIASTEATLHALSDFTLAQNALHRDLLSARVGMLRNYDPLVRQTAALREAIDRLTIISEDDAAIAPAVRRLDALVKLQEQWTEHFKSRNALLQNSLAYFKLFSERIDDTSAETALRANALATAMLRLTLDTSSAAVVDIDAKLLALSSDPAADQCPTAQALLAHTRLLRDLLPTTDEALKALFSLTSDTHVEDIRLLVMQRQQQAERKAQHFRYLLYATSLMLAGCLLWAGRNLQARSQVLRRRAAIEHALAEMSTRLINSRPSDIATLIEQGLAEVAACWQADRAYFVLEDPHAQAYQWCRDGAPFPPDWPAGAKLFAAHFRDSGGDVLCLATLRQTNSASLPSVPDDLRDWLCVPSKGRSTNALIGLDFVSREVVDFAGESGLLRMALDAIANAVERDALERDRARLENHLQQARRMETIGALTSGVAHNFNNITGAILGFAETAQARDPTDPRTTEDISEIQRAGERARNLVEQLLTFGRRNSIQRTPTNLNTLVAESRSLLEASLPAEAAIVVREPPTPVTVMGEPAQLQQVILNICNNAAQAMDLHGVVEISIDIRDIEQPTRVDIGELSSGRYGVLSISDSGRGMDATVRERIFEPFFTTRKTGNGLGLATVREIVLEHGGALQVQSKPGLGTRFDIWLPCQMSEQSASALRVEELDRSRRREQGRGETILVLEPDRERLLRHEDVLAALGYEPVGFSDPDAAIDACRQSPERFDAALLCCHSVRIARDAEDEAVRVSSHIAASLDGFTLRLPIILSISARELQAPALAGNNIAAIIGQPPTMAELAASLARCLRPALPS